MDTATKDANHQTPRQQAAMLAELGYDGIGGTGFGNLAEMFETLDEKGLGLFTVYTVVRLDPNKPKYDPQLAQGVKLLKGRDAIIWMPVSSKTHEKSSPAGDDRAVEIIREIADIAAESGLRVALYPHTGDWLERVSDAVRVVKKVDRKNVGITFNLCHWLRVEGAGNIKDALKEALPYLFLVTINGADKDGKDWRTLIQTLDRGSYDVYEFLRMLDELPYAGPIGFQGYGIGGDVHDNLKRSMNAWRQLSDRRLKAKGQDQR